MKWVIIKGVRYPSSVISAFAAYNMDNPFLKVRIRNKYHIVPFDDVNKMANQMVYLMDNYPDFVQIGRWWISKKAVMSWVPKEQAVDGSGWVISFTLSFGLEGGTQMIGEQKVFIRIMTQTLLAELVSMLFLASIINS